MWYIVLFIALALLAWREYERTYAHRLPGPTPWPFIGTAPLLISHLDNQMMFFLNDLYRKYGDVFEVSSGWLGPKAIFVNDPPSVKHFLSTRFEIYQRDNYPRFGQLFGKGIFNSNGSRWKTHRKIARPLFSKTNLSTMLPAFISKAKEVIEIINSRVIYRKELDIQDLFFRFTLDAMGEIGFGYPIGSLQKDAPFSEAFNRTQQTISQNAINPFLRGLPDHQFDEDIRTMREFIRGIIVDRRKDETYKTEPDLLSRFMQLLDADPTTTEGLSEEEYLIDIIINFIIAGRDTTACMLTWTMYLLALHPAIEERLVKEINECFRGMVPQTPTQVQDFSPLQYVLDETLRLYPSVPFDMRRPIEDDVLPNGAFVPAGTDVVYSAFILGRSEKLWDDAETFRPDRWEHPEDIRKDAFLPFHTGPQTCLGQAMAYLEAKTLLVLLLPRFHFTLVPGQSVIPKMALTLPAAYGVKMTARSRKPVG